MQNKGFKREIMIVCACCVVYMILDIPLRLTEFLKFSSFVGIKCVLPAVIGLFFGIYGVLGNILATIIDYIILGQVLSDCIYECICNLVIGCGIWFIWHGLQKNGDIHLKTIKQVIKFIVIVFLLSISSGIIGFIFNGFDYFLQSFIAYSFMTIFAGIPIIILSTSIINFIPVLPFYRRLEFDIDCEINSLEDLGVFNNFLESLSIDKNISFIKVFEIENCIEETIIRILSQLKTQIKIYATLSDSVSIYIIYNGEKYNPVSIKKDEDEHSIMGVVLIRARALRANYSYSRGINKLHIVI